MDFRSRTWITTSLLVLSMAGPACGQLIEVSRKAHGGIAFERPLLDDFDPSFPSGAYNAFVVFPLQDGTTIELMAPIAFVASGGDEAFALGNPRIRFRSNALGDVLAGDFAVNLPAATDDVAALSYGYRTVVAEDQERYARDVTAITGGLDGTLELLDGRLAVRPRLEGSLWITASDEMEFFVRPSLGAILRFERATLHAALRVNHWATIGDVVDLGSLPLTLRQATFDESTIQDLLLEAELDFGRIRPAVSLTVSLDDDVFGSSSPDFDKVLGLRVTAFRD